MNLNEKSNLKNRAKDIKLETSWHLKMNYELSNERKQRKCNLLKTGTYIG